MLLKNLFNKMLLATNQLKHSASRASGRHEPPPVIPPEILDAIGRQTYVGPDISDPEILQRVPSGYAELLRTTNGFIRYGGGLHVRGACIEPLWHSLRNMWEGEEALYRLYPVIHPEDVPFAEDSMGDQFILRDGTVFRLFVETGEIETWAVNLKDFLELAEDDPVGYLSLQPLIQFLAEHGDLEPGRVIGAWPPFCLAESGAGTYLKDVPALEQIGFLSWFAGEISKHPDGTEIKVVFESDRMTKEEFKEKVSKLPRKAD